MKAPVAIGNVMGPAHGGDHHVPVGGARPGNTGSVHWLRDVGHRVVTAHYGQVDPERDLGVGVSQPGGHDVERHGGSREPVPGGGMSQAVGARLLASGSWRFLVEARVLDAGPQVAQRRLRVRPTMVSRGP